LIPRLIERAKAGQLRRVGAGHNRIDTVHVVNAAQAHLQAADALQPGSPVAGRAYFISQGEPVNCWQWIDQLLARAGLPPVQSSVPLGVAWAAGAACEAIYKALGREDEPRMTRFLAAQLGRDHYFNITRAQQDFNYWPTLSTEEGMRRLFDSAPQA
jgi:nucleoside-diphosphate-sugar epimerase